MDVDLRDPESHVANGVNLVCEVLLKPFDDFPVVLTVYVVCMVDPFDALMKLQRHGECVISVREPGGTSSIGNSQSLSPTFHPSEDPRCSAQRCAGT
jgi:hypothetical protein